jgi:acetyl esterase/lipase
MLRDDHPDQTDHPDEALTGDRAGFADVMTRPLADGVVATEILLGQRPALRLDPGGPASPGTLLYLHGGGYVLGSPRTHAGLTSELARRAGVRAVSLDYRLAPEHPFPAAVDDALAAYRALLEDGVRPTELVIAGDSAGGGLAIATLLGARAAGLPQPAAAAVFSPWVDLALGGDSIDTKDGVDPIFTRRSVQEYADRYLGDRDPTTQLASPVHADLTGLAPLLIQVGSHELLLDDAVRLAGRAGNDDVAVTLQVWPGLPHVFQNQFPTLAEAGDALDEAARFLAGRL